MLATQRAVGAVTDGFVRDVRAIRNLKFPVFHGGIAPFDPDVLGVAVKNQTPQAALVNRCGTPKIRTAKPRGQGEHMGVWIH